jgi:hypothetical protein
MVDAIRTGGAGLFTAMERFDAAAGRVARSAIDPSDPGDLAADVAGLIEDRAAVEANAAVVRTASETQRRVLDILV